MGEPGQRGRPTLTDVHALIKQGFRPPMAELVAHVNQLAEQGGFGYDEVAARFAPPYTSLEPGQVPQYHRRAPGGGWIAVRQRISEQLSPRVKSACLPPHRPLLDAYAAVFAEKTGQDAGPRRERLRALYDQAMDDGADHGPAALEPRLRQRRLLDRLADHEIELRHLRALRDTHTIERAQLRADLATQGEELAKALQDNADTDTLVAEIRRLDGEAAGLRATIAQLRAENSSLRSGTDLDAELYEMAAELVPASAGAGSGHDDRRLRHRPGRRGGANRYDGGRLPDQYGPDKISVLQGAVNTVNNVVYVSKRRLLTTATVLVVLAGTALILRAIATDAEHQLSYRAGTHAEPQTRLLKTWTPMGSGETLDDAGWTWALAGTQTARTEFTINTPGERIAGTLTLQPQNCTTSLDWTIVLGDQHTSGTLTTAAPTANLDLGSPDDLDHMTIELRPARDTCRSTLRWDYPTASQ
ncbi:hypothetical protein AB0N89_20070 [Amycolatopsis sp. NPDC089917]|uniref:hypothetical protein n=1 Tax=Amycolatopsis sp. NPDC089917 TaxID=3155187 RepID=UPI0034180F2A